LIEFISECGFNIIDLGEELYDKKDSVQLYFKTDSHWNDFGAFYGSRILLKRLSEEFPDINYDIRLDDYDIKYDVANQKDLSKMLNLQVKEEYASFTPKDIGLTKKIEKEAGLRFVNPKAKYKILILRDSFSLAMIKFLKDKFGESVFIWGHGFNKELILREKPDIVLREVIERDIDMFNDGF